VGRSDNQFSPEDAMAVSGSILLVVGIICVVLLVGVVGVVVVIFATRNQKRE
jgi:hypothetical protein